jgi:DNA modification methylase
MKIETRKISELKGWDRNPRTISEKAYAELIHQIKELKPYKPLLINEEGIVLGGNMRLKAFKELGIDEIECSVVHAPDEPTMVKYALSDNDQKGKTELDQLIDIIGSYPDIDFGDYSVYTKEAQSLNEIIDSMKEVEEDEAPEVSDEPAISKIGEVYQLGRHRLMCGDSTKIEDVEKLMDGKKADMVFTDPPYGMDLDTDYTAIMDRGKKYDKVIGDSEEWIFDKANHFDCAEQIWWGADWYRRTLPVGGSWFVWDKQISEHDGLSHTGSLFELAWSKSPHKREIIKAPYFRFYGMDTKQRLHPTQKPVKLCAWFIEKLSKENETVVDLFGGSGSTLIACEQTNRICYGMEIDEKYCDVIRKRYAKFIGKGEEWEKETPKIDTYVEKQ